MPRNWGPLGEEVSSKVELDEPTDFDSLPTSCAHTNIASSSKKQAAHSAMEISEQPDDWDDGDRRGTRLQFLVAMLPSSRQHTAAGTILFVTFLISTIALFSRASTDVNPVISTSSSVQHGQAAVLPPPPLPANSLTAKLAPLPPSASPQAAAASSQLAGTALSSTTATAADASKEQQQQQLPPASSTLPPPPVLPPPPQPSLPQPYLLWPSKLVWDQRARK